MITVIIPVKNQQKFIAQSIESVLEQTYDDYELLVIDGNSTDDTEKIVKYYQMVKYIKQKDSGLYSALNLGIHLAAGDFITFNGSDDIWVKDKLETQVSYLMSHPEIQYVVSKIRCFLEPGCLPAPGFRLELLTSEPVARILENLMVRKSLFEKIGYFNDELSIAGDVDWYSRAIDANIPMAAIDKVLVYKRIHDGNISMNIAKNNQELLQIVKRSIGRKCR